MDGLVPPGGGEIEPGGAGDLPGSTMPEGTPIGSETATGGGPITSPMAAAEARAQRQIESPSAQPSMGGPIESGTAGRPGVGEIRGEVAQPIQSGPIGAVVTPDVSGRQLGPPAFGLPGASVEDPEAYQGGSPVGGPASIFNIGGAPIAILGGVFSQGLPIGGPVSQVFRSGAPIPNTLFASTLEPSGPIGLFALGSGGEPIDDFRTGPEPISREFREGGAPIGAENRESAPGGRGGGPL